MLTTKLFVHLFDFRLTSVYFCFNFSDISRLQQYQAMDRTRPFKRHLVTKDWVSACIDKGEILTERHYQPIPD